MWLDELAAMCVAPRQAALDSAPKGVQARDAARDSIAGDNGGVDPPIDVPTTQSGSMPASCSA